MNIDPQHVAREASNDGSLGTLLCKQQARSPLNCSYQTYNTSSFLNLLRHTHELSRLGRELHTAGYFTTQMFHNHEPKPDSEGYK